MKLESMARKVLVVVSLAAAGTFAVAQGDIYSRLMTMKEMDANKDGMISKEEFIAMVGKLWDMKAAEMKAKDGKLTPEQLAELEKVLGRTLH